MLPTVTVYCTSVQYNSWDVDAINRSVIFYTEVRNRHRSATLPNKKMRAREATNQLGLKLTTPGPQSTHSKAGRQTTCF